MDDGTWKDGIGSVTVGYHEYSDFMGSIDRPVRNVSNIVKPSSHLNIAIISQTIVIAL